MRLTKTVKLAHFSALLALVFFTLSQHFSHNTVRRSIETRSRCFILHNRFFATPCCVLCFTCHTTVGTFTAAKEELPLQVNITWHQLMHPTVKFITFNWANSAQFLFLMDFSLSFLLSPRVPTYLLCYFQVFFLLCPDSKVSFVNYGVWTSSKKTNMNNRPKSSQLTQNSKQLVP